MKFSFLRSNMATKLTAGLALTMGIAVSNLLAVDEVGYDDFEGLTLGPYVYENEGLPPGFDGTDYSDDLPTGWSVDNSEMAFDNTAAPEWQGGKVHDLSSWISHDYQNRASTGALGENASRNSVLVFDCDEWDDDIDKMGAPGDNVANYNSWVYRTYTTTGDSAQTALSFDFETLTEQSQLAAVEIKSGGYDSDPTTWTRVAQWGPEAGSFNATTSTYNPAGHTDAGQQFFSGGAAFSVANGDFSDPGSTFTLRIGLVEAGNDWWFAVDNVEITTDTYSDLTDFEGLTMQAYSAVTTDSSTIRGDGTDWTDSIPGWTSDLSNMQYVRAAPCWEGFIAHDARSWADLGGQQDRELFFGDYADTDPLALIIEEDPDNTVLVADSDEWQDNPVITDNGLSAPYFKQFNAYIYRDYDVSTFKNSTLTVTFDWQHRIESNQRAMLEVSFDGGATWTIIWDFDSETDAANFAAYAPSGDLASLPSDSYQSGGFFDSNDDFIRTPQTVAIDPAAVGMNAFSAAQSMRLRIGKIDASNNWWFAVDNILVEADPQTFVLGDANGDGNFNNLDITPLVIALTNRTMYESMYSVNADEVLDFNGDGVCNNLDIFGFVQVLTGN